MVFLRSTIDPDHLYGRWSPGRCWLWVKSRHHQAPGWLLSAHGQKLPRWVDLKVGIGHQIIWNTMVMIHGDGWSWSIVMIKFHGTWFLRMYQILMIDMWGPFSIFSPWDVMDVMGYPISRIFQTNPLDFNRLWDSLGHEVFRPGGWLGPSWAETPGSHGMIPAVAAWSTDMLRALATLAGAFATASTQTPQLEHRPSRQCVDRWLSCLEA